MRAAKLPSYIAAARSITLRGNGVPIGLLEDREYEEAVFETEPGDAILLFSDGIVDQLNEHEEDFTGARVREFLEKHGADAPRAAVDELIAQIDEFRGCDAADRRSDDGHDEGVLG